MRFTRGQGFGVYKWCNVSCERCVWKPQITMLANEMKSGNMEDVLHGCG